MFKFGGGRFARCKRASLRLAVACDESLPLSAPRSADDGPEDQEKYEEAGANLSVGTKPPRGCTFLRARSRHAFHFLCAGIPVTFCLFVLVVVFL